MEAKKHEPTETEKAIECVTEIEAALSVISNHLEPHLTYEQQHYTDKADNMERCLQMVSCQIDVAWLHAGRALKRLMVLRDAEIGRELETLHGQAQQPEGE